MRQRQSGHRSNLLPRTSSGEDTPGDTFHYETHNAASSAPTSVDTPTAYPRLRPNLYPSPLRDRARHEPNHCRSCGLDGTHVAFSTRAITPTCEHENGACRPCLANFVANKLAQNPCLTIKCPAPGCRQVLNSTDVRTWLPPHLVDVLTRAVCMAVQVERGRGGWAAVSALMDSGATGNVISQRLVEELELRVARDMKRGHYVKGIHGVTKSLGGYRVQLRITDSEGVVKNVELEFQASDFDDLDMIIGWPWLTKVAPVIDWKQATWRYGDTEGSVEPLPLSTPQSGQPSISRPPTGTEGRLEPDRR